MSDIQVFNYQDKSNKKNNQSDNENIDEIKINCPPSGPYSYTILMCNSGCAGCMQYETHSGTECKDMMFCCVPFALITDTLCLPYTITKWLCCKKK